ncbi:Pollen Ole e 1 allergen and extensin family protein [Abeliophyllum distichum]|uniref:Pollen Ole e 1 allergen and extensin family protein n=1 Tax=Abeliophyllum distichum TaxID=126358 RepID=A0ABD1QHU9_9LAMI
MSHFCSMDSLVRMVFLNFIIFFFLGTVTAGPENSIIELSSREDLVNWAGYGEEKLSTVVISGKLLCHGKASIHSHLVSGSKHTSEMHLQCMPNKLNKELDAGATVAVLCGTSGKTRKSWAEGTTDGHGEFFIDLPSHLHAIPNLESICIVEVLHLPKGSPCRQSFTGKHEGIKLTSMGEGIRTYTTHNIHLMPKPSQALIKAGHKTPDMVNVL